MKHFAWLSLVLSAMVILGCGKSDLDMVKDGVLKGYDTTTVGKAFDSSFNNADWKNFKTDKGERIVEFNGKTSQRFHDSFVSWANQNMSPKQLFELVYALGYEFPQKQNQMSYEDLIKWALDTVWPPGTAFNAQFAILAGDSGAMKIIYMQIADQVVKDYNMMLGIIYQ